MTQVLFCFDLKNGDIVFQDGSTNDFNDAIKSVTSSWEDRNFSHCGIVYFDSTNNKIYIIEALPGFGVVETPLDIFLERSKDKNCKPKVVVGRLIDEKQYTIPRSIHRALLLLGKEYDDAFSLDNDKYYCSELVYFAFLDSSGQHFIETAPMTFKNPITNVTDEKWLAYFEKLKVAIPEGKLGNNPGGLSKSKYLKIVYSYDKE